MLIGEDEGGIPRDGDSLAERREGAGLSGRREVGGTGEALQGGGIDVAGNGIRRLVEEALQPLMLAGWHQTQMAVGQGEGIQARQGAQHGDAEGRQGGAEQGFVVGAADPVQDHAGDRHVLPEGGEAVDQGCGGLGLRLHVQHQHHRPAREGCQVGGRAGAVGGAVEQAHDAFDDQEVGVLFCAGPASVSGRIAQGSRLMQGRPLAAAWNIGSM